MRTLFSCWVLLTGWLCLLAGCGTTAAQGALEEAPAESAGGDLVASQASCEKPGGNGSPEGTSTASGTVAEANDADHGNESLVWTSWLCRDEADEEARVAFFKQSFVIERGDGSRLWGQTGYSEDGTTTERMRVNGLDHVSMSAAIVDGKVEMRSNEYEATCSTQISAFATADEEPQSDAPQRTERAEETWTGTYTCGHDEFRGTLHIRPVWAGGFALGVYEFEHLATSTIGSYDVLVAYYPDRNDVDISDGDWIQKAPGFEKVGFVGHLSEDGTAIRGRASNSNWRNPIDCGEFEFRRE